MGNWRTVEMSGSVLDQDEVKGIIEYLTVDEQTYDSMAYEEDDLFYLQFGMGLAGLNQWVNNDGSIDVCGNVFERDCEMSDLEDELKIIAARFPSLNMTLHAGENYESLKCEASFVVKDGSVDKVSPLVEELSGIDELRIRSNLLSQILW